MEVPRPMNISRFSPAVRLIRQIRRATEECSLTDADLLDRYCLGNDESAFAILVRRHGPMVFGVCKRVLLDEHDAEDAFQATFVILMEKGRSLSRKSLLGNWLYGVAYRVALKARARSAKRRAKERGPASAA